METREDLQNGYVTLSLETFLVEWKPDIFNITREDLQTLKPS